MIMNLTGELSNYVPDPPIPPETLKGIVITKTKVESSTSVEITDPEE